jgi:MFS family permease
VGSVALAFVPGIAGRAVVMVAMGALLLPALPVILTVAERLAGRAAGTVGAIVQMAGNLGGLVVALLVQALVHDPTAAFLAIAVTIVLAAPLAARMVSLRTLPDGAPEEAGPVSSGGLLSEPVQYL